MRLVIEDQAFEVSTKKIQATNFAPAPEIVKLFVNHKALCEKCPSGLNHDSLDCPYPYCDQIRIVSRRIGKNVVGEDDRGKPVYEKGEVYDTFGYLNTFRGQPLSDVAVALSRPDQEMVSGKDLIESFQVSSRVEMVDGAEEEVTEVRQVAPYASGTKVVQIPTAMLIPAIQLTNFMIEGEYEVFVKKGKKVSAKEYDDGVRRLYALAQNWVERGVIGVYPEFVWRAGSFSAFYAVFYPVLLADAEGEESFIWVMRTSKATTGYKNAMKKPRDRKVSEAVIPMVNNLSALSSFLDDVRNAVEAPAPLVEV